MNDITEIRNSIETTLSPIFLNAINKMTLENANQVANTTTGTDSIAYDGKAITMFINCIKFVKTLKKKNNIADTILDKINREEFIDGLDKKNIIAFKNGVLDLDNYVFRQGNPQDMCSIQLGYNFIPPDKCDPKHIAAVKK